MLSALYVPTSLRRGTHTCGGCGGCTVAEAQAELVLNSDWPPLALLGSVGEWGDEGTNPKEERRFIATAHNRIHAATARRSRNYCNVIIL